MKAIAALVVLLMTGSIAAPVTCVGWEGAPAARRACCQRASHQHCHDQASADTCCAGHEQGCHSASTTPSQGAVAGAGVSAALPVAIVDCEGLTPSLIGRYTTVAAKHLHGPPLLLAPPLRI